MSSFCRPLGAGRKTGLDPEAGLVCGSLATARHQQKTHGMNDTDRSTPTISHSCSFRPVRPTDGAALWQLVDATGTLELNSAYFYLLFAADFGDTCLVAERDSTLVGMVVGYQPPRQPDTAFVWQIGVLPALRGQGLGLRLLREWAALPAIRNRRWITATVADDNAASQALFRRFARDRNTNCDVSPLFTPASFPVPHPAEPLYRIGPLDGGAN